MGEILLKKTGCFVHRSGHRICKPMLTLTLPKAAFCIFVG